MFDTQYEFDAETDGRIEDEMETHSADWKLGYARAALETIIERLQVYQTTGFSDATYAVEIAKTALEKTK